MINGQTHVVTKIDGELADITLKVQAIDKRIKTIVIRINKDLGVLDQHINCCCQECECTKGALRVAEGKIVFLEKLKHDQSEINDVLLARLDVMENKLCHCSWGTPELTQEDASSLLGSSLVLGRQAEEDNTSDNSYHTPPLVSSSIPSALLSSITNSDKENSVNPGVGYISQSPLVETTQGPLENVDPIPIPAPVLDVDRINCLFTVCGQRAVCTLGCLKTYHPSSLLFNRPSLLYPSCQFLLFSCEGCWSRTVASRTNWRAGREFFILVDLSNGWLTRMDPWVMVTTMFGIGTTITTSSLVVW